MRRGPRQPLARGLPWLDRAAEMSKRILITGASLAALLAVLLTIGFLVVDRGNEDGPSPKPSTSAQPTDPQAQVEIAYLRYWEVWKEANLKLDASILDEVMAEDALEKARLVIEQAKTNNEPVLIRVQHDYNISILPEFASVDDSFLDRSVRADPKTQKPNGPERNEVIRNSYTLKKVGGQWKVTFITGYEAPSPASS